MALTLTTIWKSPAEWMQIQQPRQVSCIEAAGR